MTCMSKDDRSIVSWFAFAAAIAALVVSIVGVGSSDGSESAGGGGGGGGPAAVTVTMYDNLSFLPSTLTVPTAGAIITLVNDGSQAHNMEIRQLGLTSPVVQGGQTIEWVLEPLAAGTYDFICPQPGHEGGGMVGTLVVSDTGSGTAVATNDPHDVASPTFSNAQMDAVMLQVAQQFPAATEGKGGELMEPTILDDGTKEYTLEAKIVKWEVEPGKFVDAWTYNGVVPSPTIQVYTGDKVRIVVINNLPMSHSMHMHGVRVPNMMDGVDPFTERPAVPGETRAYEFTAIGPAVGIYHPHHAADIQIPNGMFGALLIDTIPTPQKLIDKGYPATPSKTVNMVLNDAGTIGLSLNGKSFPATEPYTLRVGETMLVHYLNEGLTAHPMHLHQPTGWIIAKDGVPLDEPWPTDTVNVAPGERYSVLYMGMDPGVWAWHCHILTHAETPEGLKYMVTALIVTR